MKFSNLVFYVFISLIAALFIEKYIIRDMLLQYRSMDIDVKGKTVLVTGASTGIGEQTAYRFAEHGARIVITARRRDVLEKVAARCRELGSPDVLIVPADMSIPDQVDRVAEHTLKYFKGDIDFVILNHVARATYAFYDNKADVARWLMQINYVSYVQLATAFIPHLEASRGSLVVISSVAGRMRVPFNALYSASKFALEGFFSSWRRELVIRGSNATISILPFGLIGTENAKSATAGKVLNVPYESSHDAGMAVVRLAVAKSREHFWPWWGRLFILFSQLAPSMFDSADQLHFNMTKVASEVAAANARNVQARSKFLKELKTLGKTK